MARAANKHRHVSRVPISIGFPVEFLNTMDDYLYDNNITRSSWVVEACKDKYLKEHNQKKES